MGTREAVLSQIIREDIDATPDEIRHDTRWQWPQPTLREVNSVRNLQLELSRTESSQARKETLIGFGVLAAIALTLYLIISPFFPSTTTTKPDEPDKVAAFVMAKDFVTKRLKAPSTASFGGMFGDYQDPDKCVVKYDDKTWIVTLWVDAENGFGAKIRQHYVVGLEYLGNDKWKGSAVPSSR